MMTAIAFRVSWNTAPAMRFLLAVCVLLAVMLVTPLIVAALTPVAIGCCSYVAANAVQLALVPVVFGGLWMVKP